MVRFGATLLTFALIPTHMSAQECVHRKVVVRTRENLSAILQQHGLSPIWGKQGLLQQTVKLNLHLKDANKIWPNEVITLPICSDQQTTFVKEEAGRAVAELARPLPEAVSEQLDIALPNDTFEILGGAGYSRIDSTYKTTKAKATALSDLSSAFEFKYNQYWTEKIKMNFSFSTQQINYHLASVGTLESTHKTLKRFGVGAAYALNSHWSLIGGVNFADKVFIAPVQAGTAKLVKTAVQQQDLGFLRQWALPNRRTFQLQGVLSYFLPLGGNEGLRPHQGWGYQLRGRSIKAYKHFSLTMDLGWAQVTQNTSQTSQVEKTIMGQLGISIPIDAEEKK